MIQTSTTMHWETSHAQIAHIAQVCSRWLGLETRSSGVRHHLAPKPGTTCTLWCTPFCTLRCGLFCTIIFHNFVQLFCTRRAETKGPGLSHQPAPYAPYMHHMHIYAPYMHHTCTIYAHICTYAPYMHICTKYAPYAHHHFPLVCTTHLWMKPSLQKVQTSMVVFTVEHFNWEHSVLLCSTLNGI